MRGDEFPGLVDHQMRRWSVTGGSPPWCPCGLDDLVQVADGPERTAFVNGRPSIQSHCFESGSVQQVGGKQILVAGHGDEGRCRR